MRPWTGNVVFLLVSSGRQSWKTSGPIFRTGTSKWRSRFIRSSRVNPRPLSRERVMLPRRTRGQGHRPWRLSRRRRWPPPPALRLHPQRLSRLQVWRLLPRRWIFRWGLLWAVSLKWGGASSKARHLFPGPQRLQQRVRLSRHLRLEPRLGPLCLHRVCPCPHVLHLLAFVLAPLPQGRRQ